MDTLVSVEWLEQHIDDADLVTLDCSVTTIMSEDGSFRNASARPEYESGHIPGAGFADLKGDICDSSSPVEFALPAPEQFCRTMGALGVGDDTRVVLYDTSYIAWAARVWWMLRWVGFDRAAILDGGMAAWTAAGHPLSLEPVTQTARQLSCRARPDLVASHSEVMASIDDDSITLIDTLPEMFYRGEARAYARPGHIKGALNVDTMGLLDKTGRFRTAEELAAMHTNFDKHARLITYCGGGIAASANAFVMTRLGFSNVAVYTDSLQVWAADPANPMATINSK